MNVLSIGRSTIISEFPDFESKFNYKHESNESNDFQLFSQTRLFVEFNPKTGLEFLRIRSDNDQNVEICRVRKIIIENLYCIACPKVGYEEIALGLNNGETRLLDFKNTKIIYKFPAETSRPSVLHIDYSSSDEYISSVYENGKINIYGTKTRTKMETINIDNNSTLSRFHPTKRFHLAIASYNGSVYVYEIQSKRKVFSSNGIHAAPCRDICMSPSLQDTIISVGYDCKINIFDIRKKTQPHQITQKHPLSTVTLSNCGNYFCVGNLKGELISYDLRSTKSFLSSRKVHDCPVTRIAFVSSGADNFVSCFSSECEAQIMTFDSTNQRKSIPTSTKEQRDSFCDLLDQQQSSKLSNRSTMHRDSFDWDALTRKLPFDDNRASNVSNYRLSELSNHNRSRSESPVLQTRELVDGKENSVLGTTDFVNITRRKKFEKNDDSSMLLPLKDRSNSFQSIDKKLQRIREEDPAYNSAISEKENNPSDFELCGRFKKLPDDRNSTPHRVEANEKSVEDKETTQNNVFVTKQIENLRSEINEKFHQLQGEILFNAETTKWQLFNQNFNLWNQFKNNIEDIKGSLSVLLQTDSFVLDYMRLKEENEILKAQLENVLQSNQQ